jgi:general secretion pathway protein A
MKDFYGLTENPFALTPDPRFIAWSPTHRETFQHLIQAYQSHQPMSVVIGDRGMGKTTLLHALRASIQAQAPQTPLALLPLSGAQPQELFTRMAADLGLANSGGDRQDALSTLNAFFMHHLQADARIVLLLDATHDVPETLLEEIGFLACIGTSQTKLFHIVLAGPPSLQDTLNVPRFVPIKARVRVVCHLAPLTQRDTHAYITRRLAVAGRHETPLFHPEALTEIYRYSRGIPRAINLLCSHALLCGFHWQRTVIDAEIMRHVVKHMGFPGAQAGPSQPLKAQSTGQRQGRDAKPRPCDAAGVHAWQAKPPPSAARSHMGRLPVALLSLGVALLVAAGTFLTPGGLVPEQVAWLRALGPPVWHKRLPTAREGLPASTPGPQDQADPAAMAVQRPPGAPEAANEMEHGEPLMPGLPMSAEPFQDEPLPDPTRAPHRVVAAPLLTAFLSGSGAVNPPPTHQLPPEQFIRTYYQAINQRQYTQTWAMLSTNFKKTRLCCDPEGNYKFHNYTGWWNTIEKVEVLEVQTPERDTLPVVVLGTLRYYTKKGRVIEETHLFSLREDLANQSWLIEEQTRGTRAQHSG